MNLVDRRPKEKILTKYVWHTATTIIMADAERYRSLGHETNSLTRNPIRKSSATIIMRRDNVSVIDPYTTTIDDMGNLKQA